MWRIVDAIIAVRVSRSTASNSKILLATLMLIALFLRLHLTRQVLQFCFKRRASLAWLWPGAVELFCRPSTVSSIELGGPNFFYPLFCFLFIECATSQLTVCIEVGV